MSDQRKYSVEEIDAMRAALRDAEDFSEGSYFETERAAKVENMLRTHMLNGTTVEELRERASRAREAHFEHQRRTQELYRTRQKEHAERFPERPRPDGILSCLRVEDRRADAFDNSGFRCSACKEMQPADAFLVWVPDSVQMGERAASIINTARANEFNGHHSAWCLECARTLTRKAGG